jgi:hypothetical protein
LTIQSFLDGSDEDEADDLIDVIKNKAQAFQLASDLHEFALAQPQVFHASDVQHCKTFALL